jgi:uncharacterized phiE125 gp8 family phage protein
MSIVPISLCKSILRVDFDADDAVLAFYLDAAQAFFERHTRRFLSPRSLIKHLRGFTSDEVTLPFPPFNSLTSITYRDTAGATQSLTSSNYILETSGAITRVRFYGDLPDLDEDQPRVSITWSAGYAAGTVPTDIKLAVIRLAGTYYMNPEAVSMLSLQQVPFGVKAVIDAWACPTLDGEGPD